MQTRGLYWLPEAENWKERIKKLSELSFSALAPEIRRLADAPLDLARTNALDEATLKLWQTKDPAEVFGRPPLRLALLGSSTLRHLAPALRAAGLRRSLPISLYVGEYAQYIQEITDPKSALSDFGPEAIIFNLDSQHLTEAFQPGLEPAQAGRLHQERLEELKKNWRLARRLCQGPVIQQMPLPVLPGLLGHNEHRLPGSRLAALRRLSLALPQEADLEGVDLLNLEPALIGAGLDYWHNQALWHRTKQEISPIAAPLYGELAIRPLTSRLGLSKKCLVLDLDNTLWGGVIGDDGLAGITLGQGSGEGESYLAIQDYARSLFQRGVILAVCSKNDEANAWLPFDQHPEMLLKREHIACLKANWGDKAANIAAIAKELGLGLDSMVFVDDNPFERAWVRERLPEVAVPEFPEDPAWLPRLLSDSGYFEATALMEEDKNRGAHYRARAEALKTCDGDLRSYLKSLEMRMSWSRFQRVDLPRITQLINKTNQFNLTTRRYTESEVQAFAEDPKTLGLSFRLQDKFGNHGLIAVIIAFLDSQELTIDSWLMSCRVLGRGVEKAALSVLIETARQSGVGKLFGRYIPTAKNALVKDHYQDLGFNLVERNAEGASLAVMKLDSFKELDHQIAVSAQ